MRSRKYSPHHSQCHTEFGRPASIKSQNGAQVGTATSEVDLDLGKSHSVLFTQNGADDNECADTRCCLLTHLNQVERCAHDGEAHPTEATGQHCVGRHVGSMNKTKALMYRTLHVL